MPPSNRAHERPQTHTTAPVLEFICLFTHDLKRKQKRWQDGRMKFHTFNNRVVVHDDRGNLIGDTHWREEYSPQDGDELSLDQGGVLVQVAEYVASRDQDLTELVDKRIQERLERHAYAQSRQSSVSSITAHQQPHIPPRPIYPPSGLRLQTPAHSRPGPCLPSKHVPLNHLLDAPTGHHGRAVIPTESPYEIRNKNKSSPPMARRRRSPPPSRAGYARNLFGQALSLSSGPTSTAPITRKLGEATPCYPASRPPQPSKTSRQMNTNREGEDEDPHPPAKRRRKEQKIGYAQTLFGTPISLSAEAPNQSSAPPRQVPIPSRPPALRRHVPDPPVSSPKHQRQPEIVRIESDEESDGIVEQPRHEQRLHQEKLPRARVEPRVQPLAKEFQDTSGGNIPGRGKGGKPDPAQKSPTSSIRKNIYASRPTRPQPQQEPEELGTELRIKPRRKRGLLMMTEKVGESIPPRTSLAPSAQVLKSAVDGQQGREGVLGVEAEPTEGISCFVSPLSPPITSKASAQATSSNCPAPSTKAPRGPVPPDNIKPTLRRGRDINGQSGGPVAEEVRSDIMPSNSMFTSVGPIGRLGIGRQTCNQVGLPDISRASSGTFKLASLGRKSLRSKEVIWIPELEDSGDEQNGRDDDHSPVLHSEKSTVLGDRPGLHAKTDSTNIQGRKPKNDNNGKVPTRVNQGEPETNIRLPQATRVRGEAHNEASKSPDQALEEISTQNRPLSKSQLPNKLVQVTRDQQAGNTLNRLGQQSAPTVELNPITDVFPLDIPPPNPQQPPRVSNPATRGRKAATKLDAAGQAPMSFFPVDPVSAILPQPPLPRPALGPKMRPGGEAGNVEKNKPNMHGFQRAGGGAWSREANDLLGMDRPTRI